MPSHLDPAAIGPGGLDRRLDEGDDLSTVLETGELDRLVPAFLAVAPCLDRPRHLRIDVGEAFKIAFGMPGRHPRDACRRLSRSRPAARDQLLRLAERREPEIVGIRLHPVEPALRAIHPE